MGVTKKKRFFRLDFNFNRTDFLTVYTYLVMALAFLFYFVNYNYPNSGPYWDENYHIASAQKYINGVFFMEPHPPLGKLFIALGELILNPNKNIDKSSFLSTDFINNFPAGYSFAGVRFFPDGTLR